MPKAQAGVDAEWEKLRAADGGKGTWDESTVTNYWGAQRQAKEKLENTGVHTHFGTLFDLCVEKGSELEESKRRYKGRVVSEVTGYTTNMDLPLSSPSKAPEPA